MDHDIDYREIMTELLKRRRKLAAVRLQVTPEAARRCSVCCAAVWSCRASESLCRRARWT